MKQKVYIGTSGWSYKHWIGKFYPTELKQKDWLIFYCSHFNSVELNMTFYRTPFDNLIKNWKRKTPENFIFSVKAPRIITHIKKLVDIDESIIKLYQLIEKFEGKAKVILFQFPPSFNLTENNLKKLQNFTGYLTNNYINVFEFRNRSWWNEEVKEFLKSKNITFCSVNGLNMPEEIIATSDSIYLRFHGKHYNTLYSEEELKKIKNEIINITEKKDIKNLFVFFNNDLNAHAIINAKFMQTLF